MQQTKPKYQDEKWLREQYVDKKLGSSKIAEKCEGSRQTVLYWLEKFNIPRRGRIEAVKLRKGKPNKTGEFKYKDRDWLFEQYWVKNKSTREIANSCEANSNSEILNEMKRHNIPRRDIGKATSIAMRKRDLTGGKGGNKRTASGKYTNKGWLKEQYVELNKGLVEISDACDCSKQTIRNWLFEFGLKEKEKNKNQGIVDGKKKCYSCGRWLPVSKFYKDKNNTTGIESQCKKCRSEHYNKKYRNDPTFRLNESVSRLMRYHLKENKGGQHWEDLVGYTIEDLENHLETQFKEGMNWANYGDWHIDHIKPVSSFDFENPKDKEFQKCWALDNLQPLWAKENIKKGDKLNWGSER